MCFVSTPNRHRQNFAKTYLQLHDSPSDSHIENQKNQNWSNTSGSHRMQHPQVQIDFEIRHIFHPRSLFKDKTLDFSLVSKELSCFTFRLIKSGMLKKNDKNVTGTM